MQDEIERLTEELSKLQELSELEKETNAQLEIQISELKDKLNGKKMQMELESSVGIAELNKKIKELQIELRDMEMRYKKKLDENASENGKILFKCFKTLQLSNICKVFILNLNSNG